MTIIRFLKEQARMIVMNQDPRFQVIRYEQKEQGRGRYRFNVLIRELRTGRYYGASYTAGVTGWRRRPVEPFDCDDPLFQEVVV
jgi:hypothetical protein